MDDLVSTRLLELGRLRHTFFGARVLQVPKRADDPHEDKVLEFLLVGKFVVWQKTWVNLFLCVLNSPILPPFLSFLLQPAFMAPTRERFASRTQLVNVKCYSASGALPLPIGRF